jgi:predicted nucleic acid-binding protein
MILVDTSVWIEIFKDRPGKARDHFRELVADEIYGLCRFTQLELLQGAKDEREWRLLDEYLAEQYYLEVNEQTWNKAARIYFDLRRKGITVTSPIDCCIAQIALDEKALLLHRDRNFELIAKVRPLAVSWFEWGKNSH